MSTESDIIHSVNVVRDLGVLLYSKLTMKPHIWKFASCCFYQLRRLHRINRLVGREVTTQPVVSLILSRLDYCNSLLIAGLLLTSLEPLQRVQNAAARLILSLRAHDHITRALKQLHWLPVEFRVTTNYTYWCIKYILDTHHNISVTVLQSFVLSTKQKDLGLILHWPRTRIKFGERSFTFSGQAAWKSLPDFIKLAADVNVFKKMS
jgi:hypothetical protein